MKLFISHATTSDDLAKSVLDSYLKAFRDAGFEILSDQDLQHDEWRPELTKKLLVADAVIALISRRAFKASAWLACELFYFRLKQALQPEFPIRVVLLGDVKREELGGESFLRPAGLADFNPITDSEADRPQLLKELIDDLTMRRSFEDCHFSEDELAFVEATSELLADSINSERRPGVQVGKALDKLNWSVGPGNTRDYLSTMHVEDVRTALAGLWARADIVKVPPSMRELCTGSFKPIEIYETLLPLRIPTKGADELKQRLHRDQDRSCALQSMLPYQYATRYTAQWYIKRSAGRPAGYGMTFDQDGQAIPPRPDDTSRERDAQMAGQVRFTPAESLALSQRSQASLQYLAQQKENIRRAWGPRSRRESVIVLLPNMDSHYLEMARELETDCPQLTCLFIERDSEDDSGRVTPTGPDHPPYLARLTSQQEQALLQGFFDIVDYAGSGAPQNFKSNDGRILIGELQEALGSFPE